MIPMFLSRLSANCQDYSYKHYGISAGLVGNHVYHGLQDKTGFLWFATETGVSRFDGSNFKNFTTADGLPDNEILKLFADSKGRIWMLPYTNAVCYYYNGKIFNADNDSMVKSIKITEYVHSMYEDGEGNLIFLELHDLNVLAATNNSVFRANMHLAGGIVGGGINNKSELIVRSGLSFLKVKVKAAGLSFEPIKYDINFYPLKQAYFFHDHKFIIYLNNYRNMFDRRSLVLYNYVEGTSDTLAAPQAYNKISHFNDSSFFFNTQNGAYHYDLTQKKYRARYLENENVTSTLKDLEGNLWFTTLEKGIYRLSPGGSKNIFFMDEQGKRKPVESIFATETKLIAGSDAGKVFSYDKISGDIKQVTLNLALSFSQGHVIKILRRRNQFYFLSDGNVQRSDTSLDNITPVAQTNVAWSYKDVDMDSTGRMYFSTHLRVFSVLEEEKEQAATSALNPEDMNNVLLKRLLVNQTHSYLNERSTSVCYTDSGLYVGTLRGLKFIDWNRKVHELGPRFPAVNKRITKLISVNGLLWVGTNDQGIFCFNGKEIIKNISVKDGLTGNLVRAVHSDGNYLWVGTDRGLNKINLSKQDYKVLQTYTSSDGLISDMVNAIYTHSGNVYVGTPDGLSYFKAVDIKNRSQCKLTMLGVTVSGRLVEIDSAQLILANQDNNIRFDFVALSFSSEGNIQYYYKLSGIDADWKMTKENFLQYPTLPSGSYAMQLYAVNKFGVISEMKTLRFKVEKRLFEKSWFVIAAILLLLFPAWFLASWQIRRFKRGQKEKMANANKIAQLEQQALKAQMNPHFIFNCLNSIQQYVIDKDVHGANKFISGFSKLIRQTLDNSGRQTISVAEEESFLRSYLDLEKSRFEEKFDYKISIDEKIIKDEDSLPPMLLQPYIENCIRHGIMHKSDGKGIIDVRFELHDKKLVCTVIDNGIGRAAANAFKSMQNVNYQSKGTHITWQRIKMINKNKDTNIILQTEDLLNEALQPAGTKVTIVIPLQNTD